MSVAQAVVTAPRTRSDQAHRIAPLAALLTFLALFCAAIVLGSHNGTPSESYGKLAPHGIAVPATR